MNKTNNQSWDIDIRSDNQKINFSLRELLKCKDLILLFVRRTFVAQYKQTILGPAWAVIQPFFTTVVYSVFFGNIAGLGAAGVPNFIFYLCGTIMWTLFFWRRKWKNQTVWILCTCCEDKNRIFRCLLWLKPKIFVKKRQRRAQTIALFSLSPSSSCGTRCSQ